MYYDAHTHLNDDVLFPQWQEHIEEFITKGGEGLICVGTDTEMNARAVDIVQQAAQQFSGQCIIKATAGVHPSEVSFEHLTSEDGIDRCINILKQFIFSHMSSIVAIGECGMDGHYPNFGKHVSIQQYLLDQQCQLARHFQLPLVIHSRDGFESTVKVLSAYTDLKIYFHCRGYAMQELEVLLRIFPQLRIGFCGNVTYPTAASLRESLLFLTQHPAFQSEKAHLLLETDAPWLAPQPKRGSTNVPAYISDIYTTATEVTGYTQKKFQELVRDHWFKLYFDET